MLWDKQHSCNRNGIYRKLRGKSGIMTGTVIANPKGFCFITLDKGGRDLRLSVQQMQQVFHGDKVHARCLINAVMHRLLRLLRVLKL